MNEKATKKASHFINVWAAEDKADLFIENVKIYGGPILDLDMYDSSCIMR
jgi:hypothetical protein